MASGETKSDPSFTTLGSRSCSEGTEQCTHPGALNHTLQWSDESHGLLRKLWREMVPKRDIARRLKRTIPAVEKKANDLGLPHRGRIGGGRKAESHTDLIKSEKEFRAACEESNRKYIEACEREGGSWSGAAGFNSSGSGR